MMGDLLQGGYTPCGVQHWKPEKHDVGLCEYASFFGWVGKFSRGDVFSCLEVVYLHYFT